MGKKHTFVWDGRGERGEDARLSIMAGRTATDLRLTLVHFRILSHLGRFNHRKGWCRLSQAGLAEMFGVGRQAINAAVRELVEWQYIEKQSQAESGESFCLYRIVIDRDDEGGVSCTGDTSQAGAQGGGVSSTHDTPPSCVAEGECRVQATPVSAPGDTRVALEATPPKSAVKTRARDRHIDHVDKPPLAPRGGARPPTSYLPFDWTLPDTDRAWALKHAPQIAARLAEEAEAFRDWHAGKRRADWSACWRTWWRRAAKRGADRPAASGAPADGSPRALSGGIIIGHANRGLGVHDTGEPFAAYRERMIREGKVLSTELQP